MNFNKSCDNVESIMKKYKGNFYYQYMIVFSTFIIGFMSDFTYIILSFMQTTPIVYYNKNGVQIEEQLNYDTCTNYPKFEINYNKSFTNSFAFQYNIYCDKNKIALLMLTMVGGSFVGTILSQYSNIIGKKIIFSTGGFLYTLGTFVILMDSLSFLYIGNFTLGVANGLIYMNRNMIITETLDNESRPFFIGISIGGFSAALIIIYTLVSYDVNWRIYYSFLCIFSILITSNFIFLSAENPIFFANKRNYDSYKIAFTYIKNFNELKFNENDSLISRIKTIYEYRKNYKMNYLNIQANQPINIDSDIKLIEDNESNSGIDEFLSLINVVYTEVSIKKYNMTEQKILNNESLKKINNFMFEKDDILMLKNDNVFNKILFPDKTVEIGITTEILENLTFSEIFEDEEFVKHSKMLIIGETFCLFISLEVKKYTSYLGFYYIIYCFVNFACVIISSKLISSPVYGRKGVIIYLLIIVVSIIILNLIFKEIFHVSFFILMILYLVKANFTWLLLSPIHTLANESFPSNKRIIFYGLAYTISKVVSLIIPFLYEYFSKYLDFIGIMYCISGIYVLNQIEETLGKTLVDHN